MRANRKRRVACIMSVLCRLAVVTVKLCPAFFVFLSAVKRDNGGGPFPQVCRLCQLNSDVTSATDSNSYVTGSGMIYQSYCR